VGNGGTDGNLSTPADAKPYLVGYIDPGPIQSQPLPDGGEFRVPKNVTVMIDAGAVFKLRGANLNAGSTSQGGSDGGAIQVLGTPFTKVQFTSYSDDTIGGDSNPTEGPSILPQGGNWGGIVFRDDSDRESSRIFVNYVNNAVLTYGGGSVVVDSVRLERMTGAEASIVVTLNLANPNARRRSHTCMPANVWPSSANRRRTCGGEAARGASRRTSRKLRCVRPIVNYSSLDAPRT
jgi:hypothetical protein